ncbi:MAG TPA: A/G-specific adenine glycosylase [Burkholderiaceae bacterium]|nr:A/G-specific adenine glycosylase [Burkholderiaceae bacterium]
MKRAVDMQGMAVDADGFADPTFSNAVIQWQKQCGRHALPWQNTRDAYHIWLSEIMLQQTQVAAVIPYYQRFLQRFPDVASLAAAASEDVMAHWSGLGYYSRARNLHRCAQRIVQQHNGIFPDDPALLADLPGIGRSTAAAIAAFAYGRRAAILDGNVKRVFARIFGIDGYPGQKSIEDRLWRRAEALLPERDIAAYTQGLMDLGATLCTRSRPACSACPLAGRCVALATGRVHELPARKPTKAIPDRQATMLVIAHQGHVLLEQRPDTGIWGGLLSLPEIAAFAEDASVNIRQMQRDAAIAQVVAPFGVVASCEPLHPFSHGFTHFRLHVAPYRVRLSRRLDMAEQGTHVWYDIDRLAAAPLPAPIKKLLLALFCAPHLPLPPLA